jgi:chromate transporter
MLYLQLFLSFFKIGLFGFGGGLAIMSLIQMEVEEYGWMSPQEFVDIVAVSQVTPGPIGINCATYVGYTATGSVWGAVLTTTAIVLPSLIIMLSVCRAYFWIDKRFHDNPYFTETLRALRFTVLGLIAAAALMLVRPETFIDPISWLIFAVVALFTILPQIHKNKMTEILSHPILLIVLAGVAGYLIYA